MTALASHPADIARPTEAQPARAEAQPHAQSGGSALGLVHSSTSDTGGHTGPLVELIPVDSKRQRLRKLKSSVITAARLLDQNPVPGWRTHWLMVTLTLRDDAELMPRDIANFLKAARTWLGRRCPAFDLLAGLRYVWVMELTKAGRPHYHVLLNVPASVMFPKPDKRGWWKHGMSKVERARNAVGYVAKYASKGTEPDAAPFPKGLRIHGNGGLTKDARRELRWWLAPKWAREAFPDVTLVDLRRVVGGFIDRFTDTLAESPWIVILRGGVPHLLRKQPCLNA